MRAYVPAFPIAPAQYDAANEAQLRRELERVLRDMQQARPEDFVTVSTAAPSGSPPAGVGSTWYRTGGTPELHVWDGANWQQIV